MKCWGFSQLLHFRITLSTLRVNIYGIRCRFYISCMETDDLFILATKLIE